MMLNILELSHMSHMYIFVCTYVNEPVYMYVFILFKYNFHFADYFLKLFEKTHRNKSVVYIYYHLQPCILPPL